jgi:hypothetical protein
VNLDTENTGDAAAVDSTENAEKLTIVISCLTTELLARDRRRANRALPRIQIAHVFKDE